MADRGADGGTASAGDHDDPASATAPLYWRLLQLQVLRPNGWQRALLVEGTTGLGAVLALTGAASAWVVPVLPLATAMVVKANDLIGHQLARSERPNAS